MNPSSGIGNFLQRLARRGDLHEIEKPVEPDQEIAAITDRVAKQENGGKALLFQRVAGHPWPVATNLFGSTKRVAMALNAPDLEGLGSRLDEGLSRYGDEEPREALRRLIAEPDWRPEQVEGAACREKKAAGLTLLPALRCWPGEGGRFITLPLVHTRDPNTGEVNCGMYRAQILDSDRLTINWSAGSDGARHHEAWRRKGEAMPVAIALGGPPAAICAAAMSLPAGVDEMAMAGYLVGKPVPVAASGETGLAVPAQAEIVIEGVIEPCESALEGPFGNHTGFYTEPKQCPVMRVGSITHRENPVYPCTVVGPPPMEDCYMARATERLFLPLWQRMFPALADIHLPFEGIFHGCAVISVTGEQPKRGAELIRRMRESGAFHRSRLLVAVDRHIDIRNASEVFWSALNRVDASRDLLIDGERVGIDATGFSAAAGGAEAPAMLRPDDRMLRRVSECWKQYGLDE